MTIDTRSNMCDRNVRRSFSTTKTFPYTFAVWVCAWVLLDWCECEWCRCCIQPFQLAHVLGEIWSVVRCSVECSIRKHCVMHILRCPTSILRLNGVNLSSGFCFPLSITIFRFLFFTHTHSLSLCLPAPTHYHSLPHWCRLKYWLESLIQLTVKATRISSLCRAMSTVPCSGMARVFRYSNLYSCACVCVQAQFGSSGVPIRVDEIEMRLQWFWLAWSVTAVSIRLENEVENAIIAYDFDKQYKLHALLCLLLSPSSSLGTRLRFVNYEQFLLRFAVASEMQ